MKTPVLFLIFNRPETTIAVFEQIKLYKPNRLYIAADGPRKNKNISEDIKKCDEVRQSVLNSINWICDVRTLFREENYGCGKGVSEAISWFFSFEEEGIILEDDTIPNQSFFRFCTEMLDRHRHNSKIMHISGCYFFEKHLPKSRYSYFYSKHIHVWGWATWKSSWNSYDFKMTEWPDKKSRLKKYYNRHFRYWANLFERVYLREIDTWDYQWMFAIFNNDGLAVNPTTNLVRNIGFGSEATHTSDENSVYSNILSHPMSEICHPIKRSVDLKKDNLYYKKFLNLNSKSLYQTLSYILKNHDMLKRILRRLKSLFSYSLSKKQREDIKGINRYIPTEVSVFNKTLKIVDSTTFIDSYDEIFINEIYKFNTSVKNPIIVDCGANIGLASIYFKLRFKNAKILAYEPDPNLFKVLEHNITQFDFKGVMCYEAAISDKDSIIDFKVEGGHSGMITNDGRFENTVKAKSIRLKNLLKELGHVTFLKIDIEGHENEIFKDIAEELFEVDYLFLEYHSFVGQKQNLNNILSIISNAGMRYYIKEAFNKKDPFINKEIFLNMDMLVNIFCYR